MCAAECLSACFFHALATLSLVVLQVLVRSRRMPEVLVDCVVRYAIGVLFIKYSQLWKAAVKVSCSHSFPCDCVSCLCLVFLSLVLSFSLLSDAFLLLHTSWRHVASP